MTSYEKVILLGKQSVTSDWMIGENFKFKIWSVI